MTPVRKSSMISFLLVLLVTACGETTGPLSDASAAAVPAATAASTAPSGASQAKTTSYRPNKTDLQGLNGPGGITMVKHSSNYAVAF